MNMLKKVMDFARVANVILNPFAWTQNKHIDLRDYIKHLNEMRDRVAPENLNTYNTRVANIKAMVNNTSRRYVYGYRYERGVFMVDVLGIIKTPAVYLLLTQVFVTHNNWIPIALSVCAGVELFMRFYDIYDNALLDITVVTTDMRTLVPAHV